jgi:protein-tyrosine phosphatase/truncated hemoglobin YjbI
VLAGFRWILPNQLAGSGQPGLLDSVEADLAFLRAEGVELIVTLTERQAIAPESAPQLRWLHFPIDDMRTPTPRACLEVCSAIVSSIEGGARVLVHCKAGLGRTGMVAACVLVTMGRTAAEALGAVRRVNPGFVQSTQQERFIEHYASFIETERREAPKHADLLRPSLEYFESIGGDEGLRRILTAFYDRVFEDSRIGHFFAHTHKETIRAKQVAFMRRCFTGDSRGYMGQRPRNAHHWMVISDEDFDYREALMRDVLQEEGLTGPQIERWIAMECAFRQQIVKDKPWPLFYRGVETAWASEARPETCALDTLCDTCQGEIPSGHTAWLLGDQFRCDTCHQGATPSLTSEDSRSASRGM